MRHILGFRLSDELDVLAARQRTRQIAAVCGFSQHEQTRISTVVSELARKAANQDFPGHVEPSLTGGQDKQDFVIKVLDRTPHEGVNITSETSTREVLARRGVQSSVQSFLDGGDFNVTDSGTLVSLIKTCPTNGPYLDLEGIHNAVSQLSPLPSNVALSEASQRAHEANIKNESLSSENRQLHEKTDALISANQRKDEFLASLAHELRGPLSAVAMAAEILSKGVSSNSQAENLGQLINRQAAHMSRIVEDLLDVSRVVRNEVSIARDFVDLHEVISSASEQLAAAAARRNHRVLLRRSNSEAVVLGDRTRLVQVVANLIGNSIRYTPEGGIIEVDLTVEPAKICISVSDNGIGISAELLPTLFDMFKQAKRSTDRRNSGLGLGLALVKTLVEAHQGTVAGYSDGPGHGSKFEVYLPSATHPTRVECI